MVELVGHEKCRCGENRFRVRVTQGIPDREVLQCTRCRFTLPPVSYPTLETDVLFDTLVLHWDTWMSLTDPTPEVVDRLVDEKLRDEVEKTLPVSVEWTPTVTSPEVISKIKQELEKTDRPVMLVDNPSPTMTPISPSHYQQGGFQTWDVIHAWGLDYFLGNVVKYVSRAGKKDPDKLVEDLEKARAYLDKEIALLKGEGQ